MKFDLLMFLVLGFASYRVTRFFLIDSLFEGSREKFHTFLINKQGKGKLFWQKLYDLTSCTFCFGAWVSLLLYSLWIGTFPIGFTKQEWITVFAVMGIQAYLHVLEPDDL